MKNVSIKVISAIAIFALTFSNATSTSSASLIHGQKEKKQADKERQLEGIDIDGKRATLKEGYVFVNRTGNKVSVARQKIRGGKGGIEVKGGIECGCEPGGNGSCSLKIDGNIAICEGGGCCRLVVTIPGSKVTPRL